MSEQDDPVRLDIRLSGQVRRYHTWPVAGQQTIAEHCWQIMRIYLAIVDEIDHNMILHIMYHDIGETAIGDLPYPVKSDNPDLKRQLDHLELKSRYAQLEYWKAFKQAMLTKEDEKLFKDIELIEMAEFGMDQMNLGNSHGFIIADRCLKKVFENKPTPRLVQYVITRLDLFEQQFMHDRASDGSREWWESDKWRKSLTDRWEKVHGSK